MCGIVRGVIQVVHGARIVRRAPLVGELLAQGNVENRDIPEADILQLRAFHLPMRIHLHVIKAHRNGLKIREIAVESIFIRSPIQHTQMENVLLIYKQVGLPIDYPSTNIIGIHAHVAPFLSPRLRWPRGVWIRHIGEPAPVGPIVQIVLQILLAPGNPHKACRALLVEFKTPDRRPRRIGRIVPG